MAALQEVKCFLLDMDGTFYLGENILPGSLDFIEAVKKKRPRFSLSHQQLLP